MAKMKLGEADFSQEKVNVEQELVVNNRAYKRYLILDRHPLLNEKRIVTTSTLRFIDVAMAKHHLMKHVSDLEPFEQQSVIELGDEYRRLMMRRNQMKMMAFGIKSGQASRNIDKLLDRGSKFKIIQPREREAIELFGRLFSVEEVHRVCVEKFGLPVSMQFLHDFREYHIEEIQRLIEEYKDSSDDLRLSHKRARLEELCFLYGFAKDNLQKTKQIKFADLCRNILKDIKSEVEGDKLIIEGNLNVNLEATINIHLQQEILRNIGLRQIIVGRVAARTNLSPAILVKQLTESYYSRFSGVLGKVEEAEYQDLTNPTDEVFDIDSLLRFNSEVEAGKVKIQTAYEILSTEQTKLGDSENLKERSLELIKQAISTNQSDSRVVSVLEKVSFKKSTNLK